MHTHLAFLVVSLRQHQNLISVRHNVASRTLNSMGWCRQRVWLVLDVTKQLMQQSFDIDHGLDAYWLLTKALFSSGQLFGKTVIVETVRPFNL